MRTPAQKVACGAVPSIDTTSRAFACYDVRMQPAIARGRHPIPGTGVWTTTDASELYEVERWGKGYFSVGDDGHVRVHPTKDPSRWIDLKQLVDHLQLRGIELPVLIRFSDILKHRLGEIHDGLPGAPSSSTTTTAATSASTRSR